MRRPHRLEAGCLLQRHPSRDVELHPVQQLLGDVSHLGRVLHRQRPVGQQVRPGLQDSVSLAFSHPWIVTDLPGVSGIFTDDFIAGRGRASLKYLPALKQPPLEDPLLPRLQGVQDPPSRAHEQLAAADTA